MASHNEVILLGNLTRDPEVKYANSGTPIASFGIATNHKYKSGDEFREEVMFIDITAFGRLAEVCGEYLTKGTPVFISGRLKLEQWEKDGQKRSKHVVIAQVVQFLGKRGDRDGEYVPGRKAEDDDLSDIPF